MRTLFVRKPQCDVRLVTKKVSQVDDVVMADACLKNFNDSLYTLAYICTSAPEKPGLEDAEDAEKYWKAVFALNTAWDDADPNCKARIKQQIKKILRDPVAPLNSQAFRSKWVPAFLEVQRERANWLNHMWKVEWGKVEALRKQAEDYLENLKEKYNVGKSGMPERRQKMDLYGQVGSYIALLPKDEIAEWKGAEGGGRYLQPAALVKSSNADAKLLWANQALASAVAAVDFANSNAKPDQFRKRLKEDSLKYKIPETYQIKLKGGDVFLGKVIKLKCLIENLRKNREEDGSIGGYNYQILSNYKIWL